MTHAPEAHHQQIDASREQVKKRLDQHRAGDRHYLPDSCGVCRIATETLAILDRQQLELDRDGGLAAVAAAGYCVDEWSQWCQGDCFTYAVALMRMRADLRFGTLGRSDDDGWRPAHHFAFDEHFAYDAAGMHPLPYLGVHGDNDVVEPGEPNDWDRPDDDLIPAAQAHARRNGIFSGRYGNVAVVVVTSHRGRDYLGRLLGWKSDGHYNADALGRDGNDYHIVPKDRLEEILRIKGIKFRKRPPANLARRWKM